MGIWLIRFLKAFLGIWVLIVIALVALFSFGPISSPAALFNVILGSGIEAPDQTTVEQRLVVPDGFSVGQYASGLKKVRLIEFSDAGDLIASQPREGNVIVIKRDQNNDGRNDGVTNLITQLNRPHGLEFYQDWLYIAESDAIGRILFDHDTGSVSGAYERIITGLSDNGNHWSKSIRIKDDVLYVSMGSTCNVCEEQDPRRATIMRFDTDGTNGEIFATGLRNSVGLDFAPWDGALYATDNGRDLLGDDYPVCELNQIEEGEFYGWPFINGFGDLDPDYGDGKQTLLNTARSPVFGFRAHNAPLGMRFARNATLPDDFERSAFVALHGSWNRSKADGYKVVSLHWDNNNEITSRDFLSGFELDGNIIGRPVDIAEGPDGCLFVSDDYAGAIYRVCYGVDQKPVAAHTLTPINDKHWQTLPAAEKSEAIKQGEALYVLNACSSCHQLDGQGNRQGKQLQQLRRRYTLDSLSNYFLTPNPPMPQYQFSEQERIELSAYLLKTAP